MKLLISLVLAYVVIPSVNADTAEQLNQHCAPCHGLYGQGAAGENMPRLAGLPAWYLAKVSKDYIKGTRKNPLMMEISGLKEMTDQDIEVLSDWLSKQDVGKDPEYDIKMLGGDIQAGEKKFRLDCKNCHAADAYGKKKKDAPPLAGQYPGYLRSSIKAFFHKDRHHDNDPIDDTFDDISGAQMRDILAWTASQDNKKQQQGYRFHPKSLPKTISKRAGFKPSSMQQTVMSTSAPKDINMLQAITAMRSKAIELGVPVIPEQPDSTAELPMTVNLTFCAPHHINTLVEAMPVIANYDPCRVTIVETPDAGLQLMTVNLDMLANGEQLPTDAQRIALQINQDMLAIISASMKTPEKTAQKKSASQ